ncbi:hypothetical protein NZNM25_01960 [Nitrosopumilus zosterae]|uniref:Uncharacterized protein n=1 Tax=Nitrosopumilus zosterae TaxID=718286 RepID=A0A2S2KPI5_9ARCH|nr:hypothetical protein [Nitrosopumilus zosterae]BDQ31194.1 hypothetical protein NZOSNM25_001305 [Nitrosopumilus zosterae]GBH33405.1 hypothetical protein NZNM25_01960 [Nitrosopumilus zosterae]
MTHKTKSILFVFAFAAIMLAWPMTSQNAGADGDATITAECGFTTPSDINLGTIAIGVDSTEVLTTIPMTGTVTGTLELQATDWTGVGTSATGSITLVGVTDGETVEVNSNTYTAETTLPLDAGEFDVTGTDAAAATSLASVINSEDAAITATVPTSTNVILLSVDALGTAGNAVTLTESVSNTGTTVFPTDGSFDGAEASGVVHMQAEAIKYAITTDGTTNAGTDYTTGKAATGVDSQVFVLTTNTDPEESVRLYLQASGDGTLENLPYSGALESTFAFGSTCN